MVLNKQKKGKLGKKLTAILAALVIATSTGISALAADTADSSTTSISTASVPTGATDASSGAGDESSSSSDATNTNGAGTDSSVSNTSASSLYTPNADLYGDILVKDANDGDDSYDTENTKVFETKAGATLDFKATVNGKEVEKQYNEILAKAKAKAKDLGLNEALLGTNGANINITDQLDSTMTLVITPPAELIFPTAIGDYILDAKGVDKNNTEKIWYTIDESASNVGAPDKKTIVMKLNKDGITWYSDLAPFIADENAKIKDLNLFIKGVKVAKDATPGTNITVKSELSGNFTSNPSVSAFGRTIDWKGFTGGQEDKITFTWNTVQENKGNDDLEGTDSILPARDKQVWLTVSIPEQEKPVVPSKPDRDPVRPTIPTDPQTPVTPVNPVTPVTPVEPTKPETPEKPVEPSTPEVPSNTEKPSNNVTKVITDKVAKLPQMGGAALAGTTTVIGTALAAVGALTFKKRK